MNSTTLKVLQFICPTGFYGAERWILALANNLNKDEIQCDLAVTQEGQQNLKDITQKFQETGGQTYELPMKGRFDVQIINKLCQLIREKNIDIIHTHGYKSDIIGVIAAKKTSIKSVCTPHGFENVNDLKLKFFIQLGCLSLHFFDKIAPLSKQLCEDIKKYKVSTKKIAYIQNGVDLTEVNAISKQKQQMNDTTGAKEEKRIGFIGQMISRKNLFSLLDTFELLYQSHLNIRLILIGDGDQRAALTAHANTLTAKNNIEFLGFRQDRLALLQSFDLFAMTSSLEGIPRCLMEAMAMGIPVAAYNITGIDQLIEHNVTGLLAPLNNQEILAHHWKKLLFDQAIKTQITTNAKAYVLKHFSAQNMAQQYTQLFHELHTTRKEA